ncbi:RNA polymerase sigma factor [uncultured Gemmiger sp.]|uniref:RNA polymerase sigma factor n=1 Tax=uncultured Gemmiger sp. TaxID=1623490 RepID=UPI00266F1E39|nr:sigma-70 family RNA polymerase sigma factor [uncultured Gemmiger sp.]
MKDRELTRLLQTQPEEGLEAAMLDYAPLVKAVLNRILPQNPCDREECMADVFVSLWRNAAKLERTATPLRPWLIVTARNKGIDRYNALRRRETVTLDDGLAETLGELAEFDRATADAADLVGALVAAMEPPDRDIFLRKYYLLQSGKEIAAALDMSVESVNTRLSRGRDRLRRQLTEKGVYTHA